MSFIISPYRFAASGGMTYSEFVASITAKATNGSVGRNSNNITDTLIKVRTTMGALSSSMQGTSWNDAEGFNADNSSFGRVANHAFADVTAFNENVASGREVYLEITAWSLIDTAPGSFTRNSYTSDAGSAGLQNMARCTQFAWWNAATGMPLTNNPSIGGSPTLYTG